MLQFEKIHKANKALLLLSTSIVVASCGTASHENYNSAAQINAPITAESDMDQSGELNVQRLMRIAEREWNKGKPETALRFYSMAAEKAPEDPSPVLAVAEILRKTKKTKAAFDLYKQLEAKYPKLPDVHAGIGYTLLSIDKPYLATKSFEHAVTLDKNNAKSLGGLALALDTAGEHDKAQDYYRLAIEADPKNLTYQNNLALSLALVGRTDQAIAMFEVITAHPNATARHRQNLALVYGMAGKSADAMRYSRMDLSESDARNNALYFQALNGTNSDSDTTSHVAQVPQEAKPVISTRPANTSRQPYTEIEAKQNTTDINTQPVALPKEPTELVASARLTNQGRSMMTARTPHDLIEAPEMTATISTNPKQSPTVNKPFEDLTKIANAMGATRAPAYKSAMDYTAEPLEVAAVMTADPHVSAPPTVAYMPEVINEQTLVSEPVAKEKGAAQVGDTSAIEIPAKQEPSIAKGPTNENILTHTIAYKSNSNELAEEKATVTPHTATFEFNSEQALYYVQVASFQNLANAKLAWDELTAQHPDLLTTYSPVYTVADVEDKGTYYRVRIGGFSAKSTPADLCSSLKERDTDCYLTKVKSQIEIDGAVIASSDPANDEHHTAPAKESVAPLEKKRWDINEQTTAYVSY